MTCSSGASGLGGGSPFDNFLRASTNMSNEEEAQHALTEREKMVRGLVYDSLAEQNLMAGQRRAGRLRARAYVKAYNDYPPAKYEPEKPGFHFFGPDERLQILADLFEMSLEDVKRNVAIEPPFSCDYGTNIKFKGSCYMNFNCLILDCAEVTIGDRVIFAPGVHLYAATHSVDVVERRADLKIAYPITIGDDVWIGGNATIVGPCTIGNGVTIAAGAIVKGVIPDNVVIGGIPAKILKYLDPPSPLHQ